MHERLLVFVIAIAGLMHFLQLPGMLYFRGHVLQLERELSGLSAVARRIVAVLGAAILLTVVGTGALVVFARHELAIPGRLSFGLSAFLCLFWALRAMCQYWYAQVWPSNSRSARLSHYLLMLTFVAQSTLYATACAALWRGDWQRPGASHHTKNALPYWPGEMP